MDKPPIKDELQQVEQPQEPIPQETKVEDVNVKDLEIMLEVNLRILADLESQLKSKKIWMKNEKSITGLVSEQQLISEALNLKLQITRMIEHLKKNGYEEKFFAELFATVKKARDDYTYWIYDEATAPK